MTEHPGATFTTDDSGFIDGIFIGITPEDVLLKLGADVISFLGSNVTLSPDKAEHLACRLTAAAAAAKAQRDRAEQERDEERRRRVEEVVRCMPPEFGHADSWAAAEAILAAYDLTAKEQQP